MLNISCDNPSGWSFCFGIAQQRIPLSFKVTISKYRFLLDFTREVPQPPWSLRMFCLIYDTSVFQEVHPIRLDTYCFTIYLILPLKYYCPLNSNYCLTQHAVYCQDGEVWPQSFGVYIYNLV